MKKLFEESKLIYRVLFENAPASAEGGGAKATPAEEGFLNPDGSWYDAAKKEFHAADGKTVENMATAAQDVIDKKRDPNAETIAKIDTFRKAYEDPEAFKKDLIAAIEATEPTLNEIITNKDKIHSDEIVNEAKGISERFKHLKVDVGILLLTNSKPTVLKGLSDFNNALGIELKALEEFMRKAKDEYLKKLRKPTAGPSSTTTLEPPTYTKIAEILTTNKTTLPELANIEVTPESIQEALHYALSEHKPHISNEKAEKIIQAIGTLKQNGILLKAGIRVDYIGGTDGTAHDINLLRARGQDYHQAKAESLLKLVAFQKEGHLSSPALVFDETLIAQYEEAANAGQTQAFNFVAQNRDKFLPKNMLFDQALALQRAEEMKETLTKGYPKGPEKLNPLVDYLNLELGTTNMEDEERKSALKFAAVEVPKKDEGGGGGKEPAPAPGKTDGGGKEPEPGKVEKKEKSPDLDLDNNELWIMTPPAKEGESGVHGTSFYMEFPKTVKLTLSPDKKSVIVTDGDGLTGSFTFDSPANPPKKVPGPEGKDIWGKYSFNFDPKKGNYHPDRKTTEYEGGKITIAPETIELAPDTIKATPEISAAIRKANKENKWKRIDGDSDPTHKAIQYDATYFIKKQEISGKPDVYTLITPEPGKKAPKQQTLTDVDLTEPAVPEPPAPADGGGKTTPVPGEGEGEGEGETPEPADEEAEKAPTSITYKIDKANNLLRITLPGETKPKYEYTINKPDAIKVEVTQIKGKQGIKVSTDTAKGLLRFDNEGNPHITTPVGQKEKSIWELDPPYVATVEGDMLTIQRESPVQRRKTKPDEDGEEPTDPTLEPDEDLGEEPDKPEPAAAPEKPSYARSTPTGLDKLPESEKIAYKEVKMELKKIADRQGIKGFKFLNNFGVVAQSFDWADMKKYTKNIEEAIISLSEPNRKKLKEISIVLTPQGFASGGLSGYPEGFISPYIDKEPVINIDYDESSSDIADHLTQGLKDFRAYQIMHNPKDTEDTEDTEEPRRKPKKPKPKKPKKHTKKKYDSEE